MDFLTDVLEPYEAAIDTAIAMSEADTEELVSGVGVVVTGSVVTAGEARALLGREPA